MTATAERLLAGPLRRCRLRDADQNSIKVLTLPTILTLGRVAAVPLFISTITDWLDGYLARKMRLGSAFGAFLDPVADKVSSVLPWKKSRVISRSRLTDLGEQPMLDDPTDFCTNHLIGDFLYIQVQCHNNGYHFGLLL
ncbi:uncharacterized protein LOC116189377 isoform X2 [Punica granatum]|uniref:Uncharacterized protein LOC116189377 isoform X2 n=1 Tax=Punica granatum TaxID=22663 RepID=A0A6P8BWY8_PUNGR|nr:uncharacterized protein LOC116189377 isoform X2 [Punica granatum]